MVQFLCVRKVSIVTNKHLVERLAGSVKVPMCFISLEIEEIIRRAKKEYRESRGTHQ